VNIASRLESSVATPMSVVVGENTQALIKDEFECRSLGAKELKGKQKVVAAYEVLGPRRATAPRPGAASRGA